MIRAKGVNTHSLSSSSRDPCPIQFRSLHKNTGITKTQTALFKFVIFYSDLVLICWRLSWVHPKARGQHSTEDFLLVTCQTVDKNRS